jgi:ABC-type transport system involved in multi-copper enzyme maturation permease subunit
MTNSNPLITTLDRLCSCWRVLLGLIGLLIAGLLLEPYAISIEERIGFWIIVTLAGVIAGRFVLIRLGGPVFAVDVIRTQRRGRTSTLRIVYLALLLFVLFLVYLYWFRLGPIDGLVRIMEEQSLHPNEQARFAQAFTNACLITQSLVLIGLTPVMVGGALAEEVEKKTYDDLRVTDLTLLEIVVGKLISRVAHLVLLLLAGLPVVALLQVLGGVDPLFLLAWFVLSSLTVISTAAMSLYFSLIGFPKSSHAVGHAFASIVGVQYILGLASSGYILAHKAGISWAEPISGMVVSLSCAGSFYVLGNIAGGELRGDVPLLLVGCAIGHLILTGFFCGLCVRGLQKERWGLRRKVAILRRKGQGCESDEKDPDHAESQADRPPRARKRVSNRKRPDIRDTPVLWKELHTEPQPTILRDLNMAALGLALLAVLLVVASKTDNDRIRHFLNTFLPALIAVAFMLAALRTAETISRERQQQTLDSLLTTDLTSTEILGQKWQAAFRKVMILGLLPLPLLLHGACLGANALITIPALTILYMAQACFVLNLGLYCSLLCSSVNRALVSTFCALLVIVCGHWIIYLVVSVVLQGFGHAEWIEGLATFHTYGLTPPLNLKALALFGSPDWESWSRFLAACLGSLLYALMALGLWLRLKRRFGIVTGRMG